MSCTGKERRATTSLGSSQDRRSRERSPRRADPVDYRLGRGRPPSHGSVGCRAGRLVGAGHGGVRRADRARIDGADGAGKSGRGERSATGGRTLPRRGSGRGRRPARRGSWIRLRIDDDADGREALLVGRESEEGESMSTADNKALVGRFWEGLVGTGDSALADELLAPGYTVHYAGNPSAFSRPRGHGGGPSRRGGRGGGSLDLARHPTGPVPGYPPDRRSRRRLRDRPVPHRERPDRGGLRPRGHLRSAAAARGDPGAWAANGLKRPPVTLLRVHRW
jgi:hypothetical protein